MLMLILKMQCDGCGKTIETSDQITKPYESMAAVAVIDAQLTQPLSELTPGWITITDLRRNWRHDLCLECRQKECPSIDS